MTALIPLVDGPADLELTVIRWDPHIGAQVEAGPWLVNCGRGMNLVSLPHAANSYGFTRVRLRPFTPTGAGWIASTIELEAMDGSLLGVARPVQVFTGPSDYPTAVLFPPAHWHDAYTVLLRLPKGTEPEPPRPGEPSDYAVIGED